MQEQQKTSLPENAYRELKTGESYEPVMPAASKPKEITPYSVGMGLLMAIIFSAAAAYLGLKVGQVFEAAIPIAIIAVGVGSIMGKKNMLGQNVIIQSIGASSGLLAGLPLVTLWRSARYPAADPLPQVFREGYARQVPLPRGYGHDRGAHLG